MNMSLPANCTRYLAAVGLLSSWYIQLLADSDSQKSAARIMTELANLGDTVLIVKQQNIQLDLVPKRALICNIVLQATA